MSTDIKAAIEWAKIYNDKRGMDTDVGNLAAAFLELYDESRRWESVFDAQTSELRGLRQQVEQERKAREEIVEDLGTCELCHRDLVTPNPDGSHHNCVCIACLNDAEKRAADLQARLDRLMLEYCPNEMTAEQVANWQARQQAAGGQESVKCSRCGESAECADGCRDPLCPAGYEQEQADKAALAAAGGQESAATQANAERAHVNQAISGSATENAPAADPALPGLELAARIAETEAPCWCMPGQETAIRSVVRSIRAEIAKRTP